MTPKKRLRAALCGETLDVAPAAPSYLGLFRAATEKRYYVERYRERMRGMKRYRPDHNEDIEFRAAAIYHAYEMFREKPDWIEAAPGPARDWAARTEIIVEDSTFWYLDTVTGDRRDMLASRLPSGRDYLYGNISTDEQDVWDQSELIQNREVIDMLVRLVSLEELEEQGVFDLPRKVIREKGDTFFIVAHDSTPYTASYLLGFQGLMLAFYDNPENLRYFIERILEQRKPILRGYAEAGYDGLYVEEIFSGADVISPKLFDEFVLPCNIEYFRNARELGLLTVYYLCGDPVPLISKLTRLSCDALAFEESKKNLVLDIEDIVEWAGAEKCIFGNIDAAHFGLHASPAQVEAEVQRQIQAGLRAKGFVVSIGSPWPLETRMENINAFIAAAHAHKCR
ncbi:MAG: hypothetical protein C4532_12575 [Candidatus Abyssobacteria bacterium SURF_17]|jgi:uroporphyrinogen-III decarboxylase|uniref:Uroporphyrinogen decarboxylase (URO-D) domain-containing protein n=1 Tax=Candidatus Abyssobacteria bacterium SURF_17 TaxID=2093361 RepID=A0A419EVL5_9BACT|nr:MAG: hypothetical protein C4532_12575 [Candidatus Abyssubacteria bacterium SURF_17]